MLSNVTFNHPYTNNKAIGPGKRRILMPNEDISIINGGESMLNVSIDTVSQSKAVSNF